MVEMMRVMGIMSSPAERTRVGRTCRDLTTLAMNATMVLVTVAVGVAEPVEVRATEASSKAIAVPGDPKIADLSPRVTRAAEAASLAAQQSSADTVRGRAALVRPLRG